MKQQIYVLQHSYELENGYEETKFLGVFSSFEKAKADFGSDHMTFILITMRLIKNTGQKDL